MSTPSKWFALPLAAVLATTACSGGSKTTTPPADLPSADAVARQLAAALTAGDVSKLPTTAPIAEVVADHKVVMVGMDGLRSTVTPGTITYDGKAKTAEVDLANSLPLGAGAWTSATKATLEYVDGAWKVRWAPTIIAPDLTSTTRLRHTRDLPTRSPINAANGQALVQQMPAYKVGVDKANLAPSQYDTTARALAVAVGIDPVAYGKLVTAAGEKAFVPAITLRAGQVPSAASSLPGVLVSEVLLPLGPSQTFASGLLGVSGEATPEIVKASKGDVLPGDVVGLTGLQKRYDTQLRGTVGHTISLVPRSTASATPSPGATPTPATQPSDGASTAATKDLFTEASKPGTPLALSLDQTMQTKAEAVLASQPGIASLVVVKVGTGDILAAANSPASAANPTATFGRLAPGSTFKVVTSLALLRKGLTPTSSVPCTATVNVGGRNFKNYADFPASKVGNITLTDALANSCNTAFISQSSKLGSGDLAAAAASLGMGADHDAGYSSFFGSVPAATDEVTKAADMIGQGTVEASPMAMAGVAASVASGKTVLPWLVASKKPTSTAAPLTAPEATQLQTMMKAVVTDGSGKVLTGLMQGAKTGTAEYGRAVPPRTHAWMISWNQNHAVAAMVNDGASGSGTAAPLIKALFG